MKVNCLKRDASDYPVQLAQIYDPPESIYWLGTDPSQWLKRPRLAVVGSRKPTIYGRQVARNLTGQMAEAGIVIISGLAFGIDSIAHQTALDNSGLTVAVLPGPLDTIYPAGHRQLAEQIIKNGGTLISEYPLGSDIRKHNFIARNRIIAGLADALLIPQAAAHSGSLHTANFALEQGKTVMAVPGDVTVDTSAGSNKLLKSGATLVTDADDIFSAMGISRRAEQSRQLFKGSPAQRKLFNLINHGVSEPESLAAECGLSVTELASALSLLEIGGYIHASAGRWLPN